MVVAHLVPHHACDPAKRHTRVSDAAGYQRLATVPKGVPASMLVIRHV